MGFRDNGPLTKLLTKDCLKYLDTLKVSKEQSLIDIKSNLSKQIGK